MILEGNIFDKAGPLPGASVFISDKDGKIDPSINGVPTDLNGDYVLSGVDPSKHRYVTVRYVGFKTVTRSLEDITKEAGTFLAGDNRWSDITFPYNVQMVEDVGLIPEFQIVASKGLKWYWWALIGISLLTLIYFLVLRKK